MGKATGLACGSTSLDVHSPARRCHCRLGWAGLVGHAQAAGARPCHWRLGVAGARGWRYLLPGPGHPMIPCLRATGWTTAPPHSPPSPPPLRAAPRRPTSSHPTPLDQATSQRLRQSLSWQPQSRWSSQTQSALLCSDVMCCTVLRCVSTTCAVPCLLGSDLARCAARW